MSIKEILLIVVPLLLVILNALLEQPVIPVEWQPFVIFAIAVLEALLALLGRIEIAKLKVQVASASKKVWK